MKGSSNKRAMARRHSIVAEALGHLSISVADVPIAGTLMWKIRRLAERAYDPNIRVTVGKYDLLMPLSHRYRDYRRTHPLYDTAIGELAALVERKIPTCLNYRYWGECRRHGSSDTVKSLSTNLVHRREP